MPVGRVLIFFHAAFQYPHPFPHFGWERGEVYRRINPVEVYSIGYFTPSRLVAWAYWYQPAS
jgi:hypothetical protein